MKPRILVVGDGILADYVGTRLALIDECAVLKRSEMQTEIPEDTALGLVLDDGWNPSACSEAEKIFRERGLPWIRGFVVLGQGIIGPLVRPEEPGCSYCADTRILMADSNRREMLRIKNRFADSGLISRDVWSTRNALLHMANLVEIEARRFLEDAGTCRTLHHVFSIHLKTLECTNHFVLPSPQCPVCGMLPVDSAEAAVISLNSVPKGKKDDFRTKPLKNLRKKLVHDYLDGTSGLLNGKAQDLITPFAAVSVNLPLWLGDEGTSGRSQTYTECESIAILEGLERYCGVEPRGVRAVVHDSYASLKENALNPAKAGLHSPKAYAGSGFPFQAFDKDAAMDWVWGYSLSQQRPLLVPKHLAYYSLGDGDSFVYETSNGCALGTSLVEAVFHGILEIVERDAFLLTWYANMPLPFVDVLSSADTELKWMVERINNVAGYRLNFYNATMENGIPTIFVIAKNKRSHGLNLLCSAGAHVDPMRAVKSAVHETAGMLLRFDEKLETNRQNYLRMLQDSNLVRQMDHHSMLYGLAEAAQRLNFLLDENRPNEAFDKAFVRGEAHMDLTEDLQDLLRTFRRLNLEVVVVNQTSPEIARNGLFCVKVLIPGMLPMTFGHQFRRLEHLDRVLRVPMVLGYTKVPLKREELNPYPHPFP